MRGTFWRPKTDLPPENHKPCRRPQGCCCWEKNCCNFFPRKQIEAIFNVECVSSLCAVLRFVKNSLFWFLTLLVLVVHLWKKNWCIFTKGFDNERSRKQPATRKMQHKTEERTREKKITRKKIRAKKIREKKITGKRTRRKKTRGKKIRGKNHREENHTEQEKIRPKKTTGKKIRGKKFSRKKMRGKKIKGKNNKNFRKRKQIIKIKTKTFKPNTKQQ